MTYNKENLKIINQQIDTLVIGIKIKDDLVFNETFLPFCYKLKSLKDEAKLIKTYGNKVIKSNLGLKFGDFFISSKGTSSFFGYFYNDDFLFYVSEANTKSNQYNFKVQFRSIALLKYGHNICYKNLINFINSIIDEKSYYVTLLRFDICTDVAGIKYDNIDFSRFQSLNRITNYKTNYTYDDSYIDDETPKFANQNLDITNENTYLRFQAFEGISFGKSPLMFRIYDKIKQIKSQNISPLIYAKWAMNGFNIAVDKFVFRHEVEYARPAIKRLLPMKCDDEVSFLFNNIGKFWLKGLKICRWIDLTNEELDRIRNGFLTHQAINKIYQRALNDDSRFQFWEYLHKWDDEIVNTSLNSHNELFIPNMQTAIKYLKSFISVVYRCVGQDKEAFYKVIEETQKSLLKDGYTFHTYGLSKICDSFIKNDKTIKENNLNIQNPLLVNIEDCLIDLVSEIEESKNKDKYLFKQAFELVKEA